MSEVVNEVQENYDSPINSQHRRVRFQVTVILSCVVGACGLFIGWCITPSSTPALVSESEDHHSRRSRDPYGEADELAAHLERVNENDPKGDAERDYKAGRPWFVSTGGDPGTQYYTGIPQDRWFAIRWSGRNWGFDGAPQCVIRGERHAALIKRARTYANRYNRRMWTLTANDPVNLHGDDAVISLGTIPNWMESGPYPDWFSKQSIDAIRKRQAHEARMEPDE